MNDYDAIVVGTGMTGGWAMRILCEAGLKTLALDRGKMVEHRVDYVNEHKQPWDMPWRGGRVHPDIEKANPVQSRHRLFEEYTRDWLINDADSPYIEELPYDWIQPDVVGGKALMWSRQSWRWGPHDFLSNLEDGHGEDWPIRYDDLAPWYDHVEKTIGVSGSLEGLPQLPDGKFLPPMGLNDCEADFKQKIEAAFPGRRVIPGRTANLSEALVIYHFTSRAFLRAIVQQVSYDYNPANYDVEVPDSSERALLQLLFSYEVNPRTVLFLGYSDNRRSRDQQGLTRSDSTYFAKVGYAWLP